MGATGVQTAFMHAFAYALGDDFPWDLLTDHQRDIVNEGVAFFDDYVSKADTEPFDKFGSEQYR